MIGKTGFYACIGLVVAASVVAAQNSAPAKSATASHPVKAESVTINMPEGMTREQADAILNELREIHKLLQTQQNAQANPAPPPAQPPSDKVQMSVNPAWEVLGDPKAPVTLVEFTDYQCPFCRKFESDSFARLKKNYIDTGKVRFVHRDMPLEFHPNAEPAAEAAHCAGRQKKFWEMHDALVQDPSADLSQQAILNDAQKIGLDSASFKACIEARPFAESIRKDAADANTLGVSGTPSFVIGKTGSDKIDGVRIVGVVPYEVFDKAITQYLGN
jgi:protein-disulfide isomerase